MEWIHLRLVHLCEHFVNMWGLERKRDRYINTRIHLSIGDSLMFVREWKNGYMQIIQRPFIYMQTSCNA